MKLSSFLIVKPLLRITDLFLFLQHRTSWSILHTKIYALSTNVFNPELISTGVSMARSIIGFEWSYDDLKSKHSCHQTNQSKTRFSLSIPFHRRYLVASNHSFPVLQTPSDQVHLYLLSNAMSNGCDDSRDNVSERSITLKFIGTNHMNGYDSITAASISLTDICLIREIESGWYQTQLFNSSSMPLGHCGDLHLISHIHSFIVIVATILVILSLYKMR
jgi:hypothetical protein